MDEKTEKKSAKSGILAKLKKIKHIEIYLALLAGAVVLLIYFSTNPFSSNTNNNSASEGYISASNYCDQTEERLQRLLSGISGAGKVEVMISFESSTELVIAYITTQNINTGTDSSGQYTDNKQVNSSPQILNNAGSQIPLVLKEIYPKVIGVVVVAEGAGETRVKLDIINAVSTLMNVSPSAINVFIMNK